MDCMLLLNACQRGIPIVIRVVCRPVNAAHRYATSAGDCKVSEHNLPSVCRAVQQCLIYPNERRNRPPSKWKRHRGSSRMPADRTASTILISPRLPSSSLEGSFAGPESSLDGDRLPDYDTVEPVYGLKPSCPHDAEQQRAQHTLDDYCVPPAPQPPTQLTYSPHPCLIHT